jgi:hypothetical protein
VCVCVYTYISGMIVKEHAFLIKQEQKLTYLKTKSYVTTCQVTCLFYIFCETLNPLSFSASQFTFYKHSAVADLCQLNHTCGLTQSFISLSRPILILEWSPTTPCIPEGLLFHDQQLKLPFFRSFQMNQYLRQSVIIWSSKFGDSFQWYKSKNKALR